MLDCQCKAVLSENDWRRQRPGCWEWRLIGCWGRTGERRGGRDRERKQWVSSNKITTNDNWKKVLETARGGTPSLCAGDWRASVHLSPMMASFDQGFRRQTCLCTFAHALFHKPALFYPRCVCAFVVCECPGLTERGAAWKSEKAPASLPLSSIYFSLKIYTKTHKIITLFPPFLFKYFILFLFLFLLWWKWFLFFPLV